MKHLIHIKKLEAGSESVTPAKAGVQGQTFRSDSYGKTLDSRLRGNDTAPSFLRSRGYTLLFAVLVAALVLGVAVFILEISTKQYQLSVSARDSMYSFYAADSGIECAASDSNWIYGPFSSTTDGTYNNATLACDGRHVQFPVPIATVSAGLEDKLNAPVRQTTAIIDLPYTVNSLSGHYYEFTTLECAVITYTTGWSISQNQPVTIIDSRGYNFCLKMPAGRGPDTSNPNLVERALRLTSVGAW